MATRFGKTRSHSVLGAAARSRASAFRDAFAGCDVVLHTASPFFVKGATEENVVKPAVQGTRNVLEAVVAAGIDRVVLTSARGQRLEAAAVAVKKI